MPYPSPKSHSDQKEKYLFVLPNTSLGGAEQILKMLVSFYSDMDISVYFLTKETKSGWNCLPPNVKLFYSGSRNHLVSILRFALFLINNKGRWERTYSSHVNVTGLLGVFSRLRILKSAHFIARESTTIFQRFRGLKLKVYKAMYRLGYSQVSLLICQTDDMLAQLKKHVPYIFQETTVKVIPNPIDISSIPEHHNGISVFEKDDFIVTAGRLIKEKGFDLLIDAFSRIAKDNTQLKLLILGEGPERSRLQELVQTHNLEDRIVLYGHVKNVFPYFNRAKLCVISSRIEGFPNVLLQMMSQNNNVISTTCAGGVSNIDGLILAEPNDVSSLEKALLSGISRVNRSRSPNIFHNELKNRSLEQFVYRINDGLRR